MKANAPLWIVSLGQGGGDAAAVGGPGAPDITNPEGGAVIYFTAGEEGAAGPTVAYGAYVEPEGPTVTVESDDPSVGGEVALTNTEPFTDYVVTIYGVNVAGRGKTSSTNPFQLNYNVATGGTETIVDNYNGTTEKWMVHKFTTASSPKTFTVESNPKKFHVLLCAAGGAGGRGNAGGGGAGGYILDTEFEIEPGDYSLGIGTSPAPPGGGQDGANGGNTTGFGLTAIGGGGGGANYRAGKSGGSGGGGAGGGRKPGAQPGAGGGAGTSGQGHNGGTGGTDPGTAENSSIAGGGGGGGMGGPATFNGDSYWGGNRTPGVGKEFTIEGSPITRGKGGNPEGNGQGYDGNNGVVIVAYQIGMSTSREIAQAQAKQAARAAGYADGYDAGDADGRAARDAEIAAAFVQAAEDKPKRTRKKAD